jgi:anaerobic selenocysteine-containing dehydrogenase
MLQLVMGSVGRAGGGVNALRGHSKSVDPTRNGHSVPVVDELDTVALNIWADEHGHVHLKTNFLM